MWCIFMFHDEYENRKNLLPLVVQPTNSSGHNIFCLTMLDEKRVQNATAQQTIIVYFRIKSNSRTQRTS